MTRHRENPHPLPYIVGAVLGCTLAYLFGVAGEVHPILIAALIPSVGMIASYLVGVIRGDMT